MKLAILRQKAWGAFTFAFIPMMFALLMTQRVSAHGLDGDCGDDYHDQHPSHAYIKLTPEQVVSLRPFTKDYAIPAMLAVKSIAQQPQLWAKNRQAQLSRVLVLEAANAVLKILNRMDRGYNAVANRPLSLAAVEFRATAVAYLTAFIASQQKYVVATAQSPQAKLVYATTAKIAQEAMVATVNVATEIRANYQSTETLTVSQAATIQQAYLKNEEPLQAVTTITATAELWTETEQVQYVAAQMATATLAQNEEVYVAATTAMATATYKTADMTYKLVASYEMARVAETSYVAVTTQEYQATYRQSYQYVAATAVYAKQVATGQTPPSHDLSVTGTGPTDIKVGDDANYELTVSNNGPGDAENVVVTVNLPAEAVTADPSCKAERTGVVCTVAKGLVAAGDSVAIAIPTYYAMPGTYVVTASVPEDNDNNPQDNGFSFEATSVDLADAGLSASFAGSPAEATVGKPVTLTFTFMNAGRADAVDTQLRLDLSTKDNATWTVDSATTSQGEYKIDSSGVTYTPGTVTASTTVSMSVTYTARSSGVVAATLVSASVNYTTTSTTYVTTVKDEQTVMVNASTNNPVEVVSGSEAVFSYSVDSPVTVAATVNVAVASPDQSVTATVTSVTQNGKALTCVPLADGSLDCETRLEAAQTAQIEATLEADLNDPLAASGQMRVTATVTADTGAAGTATSTVTVTAAANAVAFSATEYAVRESDGFVTVTAVRSDTSQADTVVLSTVDGSAIAGKDYEAATVELSFDVGDKAKSADIRINDNTIDDGDRDFFVELSELRGNQAFARARVSVVDDEVGCNPAPESDDNSCSDGKDNDCDGLVDCADDECLGGAFCVANLNVTVSPSDAIGSVDAPLAYSIHVINAGPLDATVTVTVPLQRAETLVSIASTEGDVCKTAVDMATCTFSMKASVGSDITVVKSYSAAGIYADKISVSSPLDPDLRDNEATYTATIR